MELWGTRISLHCWLQPGWHLSKRPTAQYVIVFWLGCASYAPNYDV